MSKHTAGPYEIGTDDTPWTCGDSRIAVEYGEDFGHTEIFFPIMADGESIAYMPWEPLAGAERQAELRANARLFARAPELTAALVDIEQSVCLGLGSGNPQHWEAALQDVLATVGALLANIEGEDA